MTLVKETLKGFTPAQYEVINMMSCLRGDSDLAELKSILVQFLNARMQSELDRLYENGTLSDEKMASYASQHQRTAYKAAL